MANLLILTNNLSRASFRQRIGIHLDILEVNGLNCTVAQFPSSSFARRKLFKQSSNFDAVLLHKKRLNPLDAFWLRRYAKKVIYDFDDAVMYDDKTPDNPSRKRLRSFRRTVKLADKVIAGNPYLASYAKQYNTNVTVIPTGLGKSNYDLQKNQSDGRIRLVWIGSKSTLGYLAEISEALEQIGSKFNNVALRIICDEFFDLENMLLEKREWSLQTQAADLADCDIGLAPLPDNKFTRGKCGFKILQYQAAGLPVVASPVGVNARYVQDGINGFLAKDNAEWVERIGQLLRCSQTRKQMADAARLECEQFDVLFLGQQLAKLVKECLNKRQ